MASFNYAYDPVGNRTQVVEANGNVGTWTYDPTYQLIREYRLGLSSIDNTYTYDPVEQVTNVAAGTPTTYAYNAANELTTRQQGEEFSSPLITTYSYDNNGNLAASQSQGAGSVPLVR